jgi:hypothetical protein
MATVITPKITSQGVLIPREAVQAWLDEGIEVVKHERQIVIQPRSVSPTQERALAIQALREDGLLVDFERGPLFPQPSPEERAMLARKLAAARKRQRRRPLSEFGSVSDLDSVSGLDSASDLVIEERKAGW